MNCRKDWSIQFPIRELSHSVLEKRLPVLDWKTLGLQRQAKMAESKGHWAQAAIYWRRCNQIQEADRCELNAQQLAEAIGLLSRVANG